MARKKYGSRTSRTQFVGIRIPHGELEQLDALAHKLGYSRTKIISDLLFRGNHTKWQKYERTIEGLQTQKRIENTLTEICGLLKKKTQELKPDRISIAKYAEVTDVLNRLYNLIS
jgi:hypothetical protein